MSTDFNLKKKQKPGFQEFPGLAVQWSGLCAFTAKGLGSILGRGTKIPEAACSGQKHKTNIKPKPKAHILYVFYFTFSSNSFNLFYLSLG